MKHIGSLGKKRRITNAQWQAAYDAAPDVPAAHLDALVGDTLARLQEYGAMLRRGKRLALAWSGGKDSLVLARLLDMAGASMPHLWARCNLEYPAILRWTARHNPGVIQSNVGLDLAWLRAHPGMLFPRSAAGSVRWFQKVNWAGQTAGYKDMRLNLLLVGRRAADGNNMGKVAPGDECPVYTNAEGITRAAPLWAWTHEELFAFIRRERIALPPYYQWVNGWITGSGCWAKRRVTHSDQEGWDALWSIDPSIVRTAAGSLPSAQRYMARKLL